VAREAAGLSQEDVAKHLALASHSAVSAMEAGTRRVSADELAQLGALYGKALDWFFNPDATREDFVALARAQNSDAMVKDALRRAQRLVENFVLLKKLLGAP
jgi:transcriptional regulator with XRE-family HTH domain